jgi:hypothetical protein
MYQTIAQLVFLCIRGLLLWVLIPAGFLIWLFVAPYRAWLRRPFLGPMRFATWLDLNVGAAIARVVLRPLGREFPYTSWSDIGGIEHTTKLRDLW